MPVGPMLPGEEPFSTGGDSPYFSQRKASYHEAHKNPPSIRLNQPAFNASEEKQDQWAAKQHAQEARRQTESERAHFEAARRGEPLATDDPAMQMVSEYGEEMHAADRRHDFMIGVSAFGRTMQGLTSFGGGGTWSQRLAHATHRVPVMRRH